MGVSSHTKVESAQLFLECFASKSEATCDLENMRKCQQEAKKNDGFFRRQMGPPNILLTRLTGNFFSNQATSFLNLTSEDIENLKSNGRRATEEDLIVMGDIFRVYRVEEGKIQKIKKSLYSTLP